MFGRKESKIFGCTACFSCFLGFLLTPTTLQPSSSGRQHSSYSFAINTTFAQTETCIWPQTCVNNLQQVPKASRTPPAASRPTQMLSAGTIQVPPVLRFYLSTALLWQNSVLCAPLVKISRPGTVPARQARERHGVRHPAEGHGHASALHPCAQRARGRPPAALLHAAAHEDIRWVGGIPAHAQYL